MLKIFKDVRETRNESLLDILGLVARGKNLISLFKIEKAMARVYSNVHKNTVFLEGKGFLVNKGKREGRKKKLYDITIKGALASLFSSLTTDYLKLVEIWQQKDWGNYRQPFKNIRHVSELKKFVETLYLHGGSLEEVDEGLLRRGLRDPQEAIDLITRAFVTVKKTAKETGEYEAKTTFVPGSVAVGEIRRQDEPNNVFFVVGPREETGELLFDFFSRDPTYRRQVGEYLQAIVEMVAQNLLDNNEDAIDLLYFPNTRRFIVSASIPERVTSLLDHPKQVLNVMKNSYGGIIRAFNQNDDFVNGTKAQFIFQALKYNSNTRELSPLSKHEIKEKAQTVLKKISKE